MNDIQDWSPLHVWLVVGAIWLAALLIPARTYRMLLGLGLGLLVLAAIGFAVLA